MTSSATDPTPDRPAPGRPTPGGPGAGRVHLVRPVPAGPPLLDADQAAVVARPVGAGPVVVTGAPGTGKTLVVVESVVARVRAGADPGSILVLAPSRRAAGLLRDRISLRLAAAGTAVREPVARTPASYAFGLIRRHAHRESLPVPRLISGPEQDDILRDLLAGHAAGDGRPPPWPDQIRACLTLSGFRHELRDLLMRALERGLFPEDLAGLGRRHGRPLWEAASFVLQEYLDVTALATPGGYDPAAIVDHAATLLAHDPDLLAEERDRVRFVGVDDHHESGEAVARLLDQLSGQGADLLLVGDPDATAQGFRGGLPHLLGEAVGRYPARGAATAATALLRTCHRLPRGVAEAAARVVQNVGALPPLAGGRRAALLPPVTEEHPVQAWEQDPPQPSAAASPEVAVVRTAAHETALIAERLRRAHLVEGVPWPSMAVIVRSGDQREAFRRALSQAAVPISGLGGPVSLRDEPAVQLLAVAVRLAARSRDPRPVPEPGPDELEAVHRLLRDVGGADRLVVARLTRRLLLQDRAGGGSRTGADLLLDLVCGPGDTGPADEAAGAAVDRVRAVVQAGRDALTAGAAPDVVLWQVWQATGFADPWRRTAIAGGRAGRRADRDLDAVMSLFAVAERFGERMPGADLTVLLDQLARQDLPEDSVADLAPDADSVAVLTVQQAAGREWDLVVVAGVQEGVWPNTRLRGSLLDAPGLVDAVAGRELADDAGRRAAHTAVLHDELRLFYVALTRTRRDLLVTAVSGTELVPSDLVALIGDPLEEEWAPVRAPRPMTLAGVVAQARVQLQQALGRGDTARADTAAALLRTLAEEGVPGADPEQWYRVGGLSDLTPLVRPGQRVQVSPSSIESYQQCELRWMLTRRAGANTPAPAATAVGTLVHDLAHTMPDAPLGRLHEELDRRWPEVGAQPGWVSERLRAQARAMLEKFCRYRDQAGPVVGSEVPVRVRVEGEPGSPGIELNGRLDRVEEQPDGRVLIVDLKTGGTQPTRAELPRHPQLGAYQLAVDHGGLDEALGHPVTSAGARLVQLGTEAKSYTTQDQGAHDTDEDPQWALTMIRSAGAGMAGARFRAVAQKGCRSCPVRSSCPLQPEGRRLT